MTNNGPRVAIVFPVDAQLQLKTTLDQSRFAAIAQALRSAGIDVVGAPFANEFVNEIRTQLLRVNGVLVWFNPIEGGADRSALNELLTETASRGVCVSAHPGVIAKMGTKEVLYRTRSMSWGTDTRLYETVDAMQIALSDVLLSGTPRVLKRIRGQSGDGVWKVGLADQSRSRTTRVTLETVVRVRHAKRGCVEERISFGAFLSRCRPYFEADGGMIDQAYQARLQDGMLRCYVVRDRVAGFGEQLVNALYPAATASDDAPQPGPRHYFPPTRPDLQDLKTKLEREWIPELCRLVELTPSELSVIWDADFLYGQKDADGSDTFVLCEINVSSVYPFPPDALAPLVEETIARIRSAGPPTINP